MRTIDRLQVKDNSFINMIYRVFNILFISGVLLLQTANADSRPKKIELILDASGSMMSRINGGDRKIDIAKKAIKNLLKDISSESIISFRAYGHQSHKSKKDCKDTQLLVNFAPISKNKDKITSISKSLKAQGYTPITYVLKLAAEDFKDRDSDNVIILVSDGKETCDGDPCATAKALANSGISKLVIHTIGFGVDYTTRRQLECISRVTDGNYYSASNFDELANALSSASKVEAKSEETTVVIKIKKKKFGRLEIIRPDISGHKVIDTQTGKKVGKISHTNSSIKLKEGIYNITIGATLWKSIEIKGGETTTLKPARLIVKPASVSFINILDAETDIKHGYVSNTHNSIALMPGYYNVIFGKTKWSIELKEGEEKILQPGVVEVKGASGFIYLYDKEGQKIGHVSNTTNWMPLPPGEYSIKIDGEKYDFSLKEAETKIFKLE